MPRPSTAPTEFQRELEQLRWIQKPKLGPSTEWTNFERRQQQGDYLRSFRERQQQESANRLRDLEAHREQMLWRGLGAGVGALLVGIAVRRYRNRAKAAESQTDQLNARVRELEEKLRKGSPPPGGHEPGQTAKRD